MNKTVMLKLIAVLVIVPLLVGLAGQSAQAQPAGAVPTQTIFIPGSQITALAVYETGNKVFAADDNSKSLKVIDGATRQVVATVQNVGGAVFDMAVNETYGKVYAASDKAC